MLKGVLDLCVLAILRDTPLHAYGLVEALHRRGFDQTSYGTVYPLVTRLRRLGLVSQRAEASSSGPARNVLAVSEAGIATLTHLTPVWLEVSQRVSRVLATTTPSEEQAHA